MSESLDDLPDALDDQDCPHCGSDRTNQLGGWAMLVCTVCGHEWLYNPDEETP